MRYQGSEAYSMDVAERRRERLEQQAAPSFEVVSGGGLDARARAGVSPLFVARVRAVLVLAACLVALGMARVALSSATVSLLSANSELSSQVEEAQVTNEQLRVQRSVLSSNSRISRIATQNYGMVLPSEFVTVDLTEDEAQPTEGEGGSAEADPAAEPAASDGDAAQTADDASAEPSVS